MCRKKLEITAEFLEDINSMFSKELAALDDFPPVKKGRFAESLVYWCVCVLIVLVIVVVVVVVNVAVLTITPCLICIVASCLLYTLLSGLRK